MKIIILVQHQHTNRPAQWMLTMLTWHFKMCTNVFLTKEAYHYPLCNIILYVRTWLSDFRVLWGILGLCAMTDVKARRWSAPPPLAMWCVHTHWQESSWWMNDGSNKRRLLQLTCRDGSDLALMGLPKPQPNMERIKSLNSGYWWVVT